MLAALATLVLAALVGVLMRPAAAPAFSVGVGWPLQDAVVHQALLRVQLDLAVAEEDRAALLQTVTGGCVLLNGARSSCGALPGEVEVVLFAEGDYELRGVAIDSRGLVVGQPGPPVRVQRSPMARAGKVSLSPPPPVEVAVTAPPLGALFSEGSTGVRVSLSVPLPAHLVPGSKVTLCVVAEGCTQHDAKPQFHLYFHRYGGSFVADVALTQLAGVEVAEPKWTWVLLDTQAEDVDYGREPADWRGLAAQLGSFSVPAMTRLLVVADVGAVMNGQKQMFLTQFKLLPRSRYSITLVDLMCRPEEELGHDYIREIEAAGVRIVKLCLLFPPDVKTSDDMVQALRVLHDIERWADVPAELQRMLVELFLTMRGQDVMLVGNSKQAGQVDHLVQLARLAQVPVRVVDMGGLGPKAPVNPHNVTAFLGSSHFVTQHPALLEHGVPAFVVNPYVDVSLFSPGPGAGAGVGAGVGAGKITLGMLGRLSREKNPALFVSMAALLDPQRYRFVVIGDGPLRSSLERYAAHLGVQLEFAGSVPHAQLPQRLRELDLLVCPILQHDTFTISNIEAMATGVPVAGFAYGGMRGYMRHGVNSLVTSDYSARGLATLVSGADRAGLQRLGASARAFVAERYDAETTSQNLEAFYALAAALSAEDSS